MREESGELLGSFAPAWAVDAEGRSVPTSYDVGHRTLVQRIQLSPGLSCPIVADPFWIPFLLIVFLLIVATTSHHAAKQAAARGISQQMVRQAIQNGKASPGDKGTTVFTQGSGRNRIRVVVDNKTGNVVTVTKG